MPTAPTPPYKPTPPTVPAVTPAGSGPHTDSQPAAPPPGTDVQAKQKTAPPLKQAPVFPPPADGAAGPAPSAHPALPDTQQETTAQAGAAVNDGRPPSYQLSGSFYLFLLAVVVTVAVVLTVIRLLKSKNAGKQPKPPAKRQPEPENAAQMPARNTGKSKSSFEVRI